MHFLLAGWLILAQGVASSVPVTKLASARIEGNVIRSGTGEPVAMATVTLKSFSSGPQIPDKTVNTDRLGHFVFPDLDAGNYQLSVFSGGYVIPQANGGRVALAAGQAKTDFVFQMVPTSTVAGRVFDAGNQPLTGAQVAVLRVAYDMNGERMFQAFEQTRTNDLGEYRLFWVTPGQYFLRADYSGTASITAIVSPNEYSGPRPNYVSTYYPNTAVLSSASPLSLEPGREEDAIDISMVSTKTYSVKGRAISTIPGTTTANGNVSMSLQRVQGITFNSVPGSNYNGRIDKDGAFEIKNVAPGAYTLSVGVTAGPNVLSGARFNITKTLDVGEGDVEGLQITLTPPFDIPGQITFEGLSTDPSGKLPTPRVSLRPVGDTGARAGGIAGIGGVLANPDGSFVQKQVAAGTYHVLVGAGNANSYIKSITLNGEDVLQNGFTLDHTPDNPLEAVISFNGGQLDGTVLDKDNSPVASRHVILIPADRSRSDLYRDYVADGNGKFSLRGLTPGSYKLFSWDSIENNAYRNPDFLNLYEDRGLSVAVTEGPNSPVEVHVIPQ